MAKLLSVFVLVAVAVGFSGCDEDAYKKACRDVRVAQNDLRNHLDPLLSREIPLSAQRTPHFCATLENNDIHIYIHQAVVIAKRLDAKELAQDFQELASQTSAACALYDMIGSNERSQELLASAQDTYFDVIQPAQQALMQSSRCP